MPSTWPLALFLLGISANSLADQPLLPATCPGQEPTTQACVSLAKNVDAVIGLINLKLTENQKLKIEQISSIFENSTPVFQYSFIADIGDGAGITAGRVGFTSKTGDLLDVVKKYVKAKKGKTPLALYLKCLEQVDDTSTYGCLFPSVPKSLSETKKFREHDLADFDFGKAWTDAANDPVMKRVQDGRVKTAIYPPAYKWARKLGINTAFGFAVIFDTILQQGDETSTNEMGGMVRRTNAEYKTKHGGDLKKISSVAEEKEWLLLFLKNRRETQKRLYVEGSDNHVEKDNVYDSTARTDSLVQILTEGNLDLKGPIQFTYAKQEFVIP